MFCKAAAFGYLYLPNALPRGKINPPAIQKPNRCRGVDTLYKSWNLEKKTWFLYQSFLMNLVQGSPEFLSAVTHASRRRRRIEASSQ